MSVMLFRSMAINAYIIMDGNNARKVVCHLVHVHLKDVLGHLQTEEHVQEPISTMMDVKGDQV